MTNERKLIPMEQGMELFNRYANSLNVVIVSQIKGCLREEILRQALDLIQQRHPRLNSHIIDSSEGFRFQSEETSPIPLQIIINFETNCWQKIVVDELNTKIDSDRVLMRTILIKPTENSETNYLITTGNHAIIDAISGIYLHSEILKYCQSIVINNRIPQISELSDIGSLDELIANVATNKPELKRLGKTIDFIKPEQIVPHQQRTCRLIHKQLHNQLTTQIINSCKEKSITVHSAICSAMMLALAGEINKKNQDLYFSCRSSVDMRKRLNPPISDEHIAMMVSALTSFHSLNENTSFWDLAREVSQQIKERLETDEIYNVILNYQKGTEYLLDHPESVPFSIFVTNIGKVTIPFDYEPFEIKEISYALSTTVMGSVFAVAISTFQERMNLNFIFAEPLLNQVTVERLIEKTLIHLNHLQD